MAVEKTRKHIAHANPLFIALFKAEIYNYT